jgi:hypothetical protein
MSPEALLDRQQADSARAIDAHLEQALTDIVESVMRGETYPRGRPWCAINLADFLDQRVSVRELLTAYFYVMTGTTRQERSDVLESQRCQLEKRLRDPLMGSDLVRERAADLAQENEEDARGI